MTKHGVEVVPEDTVVGVAAGRHFSFPPPRTGDSCKMLAGQIDLGAAMMGSWLDSMKASSPRHRLVAPRVAAAGDAEHDDWMEKHPSALGEFEALAAAASGKQIVMFLDYDGTLSPIVEDPERAVMTDEMRDAVRGVAEHFPTAIVSGRGRDKVFNFVRLAELYYAGSHGMDIKGPTNHHLTRNKAEEGHATAREWSVEQCRKAKVKSHLEFGRMVAVFGFVVLSSWLCLPKGANRSNNGRFTFSLLLAFATFLSGKALMLLGMNMLRLPENLVSGGERAFSFLIVICTVLPVMTLASLLALLPSMLYLCLSLALITAVVLPVVAAYWYMRRRREGGDEAAAYEEHKEEHDVASKIA